MKEYRIKLKVKNNYMLTIMEQHGIISGLKLSEFCGVNYCAVMHYLNLTKSPLDFHGKFKPNIKKIAEALNVNPELLFPGEHLFTPLEKNTATLEMSKEDIRYLTGATNNSDPLDNLLQDELNSVVKAGLNQISPRERHVVEERHMHDVMMRDIEDERGVTSAALGQMERKGLRRLSHPNRVISQYLDDHEKGY